MTKPLPLCCIKQNICPDLKQFNPLIEKISPGKKNVLFNEIYMSIFEKNKCLHPSGRSVVQLIDTIRKDYKGN